MSTVLVVIGAMCLAHAVFMMYSLANTEVEEVSESGAVTTTTLASSMSSFYFAVVAESVIGFLVLMGGYIRQRIFIRSRLIDNALTQRYDSKMRPGMGFVHFNHRGTLGDGRY